MYCSPRLETYGLTLRGPASRLSPASTSSTCSPAAARPAAAAPRAAVGIDDGTLVAEVGAVGVVRPATGFGGVPAAGAGRATAARFGASATLTGAGGLAAGFFAVAVFLRGDLAAGWAAFGAGFRALPDLAAGFLAAIVRSRLGPRLGKGRGIIP